MQPTVTGYSWFLYNIVGIPVLAMPTDSPVIAWSFNVAMMIVNPTLAIVGSPTGATPPTNLYVECVYNLATDILINHAQDQAGRTYFADLRNSYNINSFAPGVVTSSTDSSTSTGLQPIEAMKNLTLANLQNLKTPYGRTYLGYAQAYGTLWGLT
jgi:hypothetical protein